MRYSFYRAGKRILWRLAIYLFIIIQIAGGIVLLTMSLNSYYVEKEHYDAISEQMTAMTTMVESNPVTINSAQEEAITYDDYLYLEKLFGGRLLLRYSFIGLIDFMCYPDKSTEIAITSIHIVFMGANEMTELFGFVPEASTGYAGQCAVESLEMMMGLVLQQRDGSELMKGSYFNLNDSDVALADHQLIVEGVSYRFEDLPMEVQDTPLYTYSDEAILGGDMVHFVKDCIFFPLEIMPQLKPVIWPAYQNSFRPRLFVQSIEKDTGALWELLQLLGTRHGGEYTYRISDTYLVAQRYLDDVTDIMKRNMFLAVMELLIISFSTAGIMYLVMQRRKKDIAVSIISGSTFLKQILELLCEVIAVVVAGLIVGIAAYYEWQWFGLDELKMNIKTILILAATGTGISAIASSLSLYGLLTLSPIEILQII